MIVQDYAILIGGRNMKILIADDEKMMRLGMKKEVVASGRETLSCGGLGKRTFRHD